MFRTIPLKQTSDRKIRKKETNEKISIYFISMNRVLTVMIVFINLCLIRIN
jgi:hypothetical protein